MNTSEEKGSPAAQAVEDLGVHQLVELADRPVARRRASVATREPLARQLRGSARAGPARRPARRGHAGEQDAPRARPANHGGAHGASVQWSRMTPHPRPLHRQGAGPAVRHRGGRLHVLPRHRPHLPAHRPRHHQERALRTSCCRSCSTCSPPSWPSRCPWPCWWRCCWSCGRLAGDLEVAALKASGVSPLRLFRPVPGRRRRRHAAHRAGSPSWSARGRAAPSSASSSGSSRRAPPPASRSAPSAPTFSQFVIYVDEVSASQVRAAGPPRLRRARPGAVPHHRGPRGPAPDRRGEPPHHPALPRRLHQRGRRGRPRGASARPTSASTT